jgi:hypothetical protein
VDGRILYLLLWTRLYIGYCDDLLLVLWTFCVDSCYCYIVGPIVIIVVVIVYCCYCMMGPVIGWCCVLYCIGLWLVVIVIEDHFVIVLIVCIYYYMYYCSIYCCINRLPLLESVLWACFTVCCGERRRALPAHRTLLLPGAKPTNNTISSGYTHNTACGVWLGRQGRPTLPCIHTDDTARAVVPLALLRWRHSPHSTYTTRTGGIGLTRCSLTTKRTGRCDHPAAISSACRCPLRADVRCRANLLHLRHLCLLLRGRPYILGLTSSLTNVALQRALPRTAILHHHTTPATPPAPTTRHSCW